MIASFGAEQVLAGVIDDDGKTLTEGSDKKKIDTRRLIPDNLLRIAISGAAGNPKIDAYAFSAVRFIGTCGDIDRLLEVCWSQNWTTRDDAMCALGLALAVD